MRCHVNPREAFVAALKGEGRIEVRCTLTAPDGTEHVMRALRADFVPHPEGVGVMVSGDFEDSKATLPDGCSVILWTLLSAPLHSFITDFMETETVGIESLGTQTFRMGPAS